MFDHVGAYNFFVQSFSLLISSNCRQNFTETSVKLISKRYHKIITMLAAVLMSENLILWKHRPSKASVFEIYKADDSERWMLKLRVNVDFCDAFFTDGRFTLNLCCCTKRLINKRKSHRNHLYLLLLLALHIATYVSNLLCSTCQTKEIRYVYVAECWTCWNSLLSSCIYSLYTFRIFEYIPLAYWNTRFQFCWANMCVFT